MYTRARMACAMALAVCVGVLSCVVCPPRLLAAPASAPGQAAAPMRGLPAQPVDEPVGARYSLGLTLWHLGHDPEAIGAFHQFLQAKGIAPQTLLPGDSPALHGTRRRVLVEPERLSADQRNGWGVEGGYLTAAAGDNGTIVTFPLVVDRAGFYRLWVRYYAWPTGSAVTRLTLRRSDRLHLQPLVNDEIYDLPAEKEGPAWKSILLDLEAGEYTVSLGPVVRWWHAQGIKAAAYLPRKIDCLYLTDEAWADAPEDAALQRMKASRPPTGLQWNAQPSLPERDRATAELWRVRPVSWEDASAQPRLFELSREFWRRRVDDIARRDYADDALPDYRRPERQVIFDDGWNMVGNPVRIRRQIESLRSDIADNPKSHVWHWLHPGEFETVTGDWKRQGDTLHADWSGKQGTAEQALKLDAAGEYHVWVRFRQINHQETWKLEASDGGGQTISFTRDQMKYDADIIAQSAWQKVGSLKMDAGSTMRLKFSLLPLIQPATYRFVYDVFVTSDGQYQPRGTVRPPLSREQYQERAKRLGAEPADGYVLRVKPGIESINQDWWPRAAERPDLGDAPPGRLSSRAAEVVEGELRARDQRLVLARDMHQSLQFNLRSIQTQPITLHVAPGALRGPDGKLHEGHVEWRVVAFAPIGNTRQQWSPVMLLRRPTVTIPPFNVAQVWLTVNTTGLAAGDYRGEVKLRCRGLPDQFVPLRVHVAPLAIAPRQPVLVSGYTPPPEGEEYLRSFVEHGLNVWFAPMAKADMRKWGIRLLLLQQDSADPAHYRKLFDQLKALGLDYDDYVLPIRDEPTKTTAEDLKDYLDTAKAIRAADPKVRISFNPGEAAKVATFEVLDPWCDFWLPYSLHAFYVGDLQKKIDIYAKKPWMWYTTPCLWDKSPTMATQLFNQIRHVPAMPGKCVGTAFFAFYYPFRDPWDTSYEHIPDAAAMMLPSRHGPVWTPAMQGIREGAQAANLALMVKDRAAADDPAAKKVVESGTVGDLIDWLEARPAP